MAEICPIMFKMKSKYGTFLSYGSNTVQNFRLLDYFLSELKNSIKKTCLGPYQEKEQGRDVEIYGNFLLVKFKISDWLGRQFIDLIGYTLC